MLDYVLLAILAYFAIWGFRKGLIQALGSIAGLILAVVIASRYFEQAADLLSQYVKYFADNPNFAKIAAFVILLVLINRVIVFIIGFVYKAVAIVPFIGFFNRLLGLILGLLEGAVALGLVIYFASRFPFGSVVESFLDGSQIAPYLLSIGNIVLPLIPDAIKQIEGLV